MTSGNPEQVLTDERLDSLERWRDDMEAKFKAAFPHGDFVGHCGYHDLMIEQIRDRKRLIAAVQEKTIGGLVWAGIVGAAIAAWQFLKAQLR